MLQGRMSCLWAPRHSESPMLVINIHQAGSATLELQQRMWIAQGIQLTCMHDLGITTSRNLSLQDQELLLDAPEWRAMLQADIQRSKNQLDSMAKKQTRRCEHQVKRQETREYLRDRQGPSNFCGNTHSLQMPKELVLGMPVGIMWINQDPTTTEEAMEKKVREAVPSVSIQWSQAEVVLLFPDTTKTNSGV